MKRIIFISLIVLTFSLFYAGFANAQVNCEWSISGGQFWGHPNTDGSYSIAFNYSAAEYKFTKIEVIQNRSYSAPDASDFLPRIGLFGQKDKRPRFVDLFKSKIKPAVYENETVMVGTIYPQTTQVEGCTTCHVRLTDNKLVKFDGNLKLIDAGSYIIQLKGYLPDGSSMIFAEIRRVLERFVFELDQILLIDGGAQITYICFPIFGNSIADGTPVRIQFGEMYDSVMFKRSDDGNMRCIIVVPDGKWNSGECVDTFFDIQGDLWRQHSEILYPAEAPWQRPDKYNWPY